MCLDIALNSTCNAQGQLFQCYQYQCSDFCIIYKKINYKLIINDYKGRGWLSGDCRCLPCGSTPPLAAT